MGIGLFEDAADIEAVDRALELGVEVVSLNLIWPFVESAPGTFDGPQSPLLVLADTTLASADLSLQLTAGPISELILIATNVEIPCPLVTEGRERYLLVGPFGNRGTNRLVIAVHCATHCGAMFPLQV